MKRLFIVSLLLLSTLGILAVLYVVPDGAGGTWDSVVYSGTARNLAGGMGFYLAHWLPPTSLSHWAPLYPIILAIPAYFDIDPTESARWINGFLLGCSISLTGFIAWAYCGRSYAISLLAALLILFSPDTIEIHSQVLSEPLFITFVLASVAMLLLYADSGKNKHLIGVSIAISGTLLTRYAGIFIILAVCIILALILLGLKQRSIPFINFGLALIIAILPLCIWIIHNVFVEGDVVGGRQVVFHPIGLHHFRNLFGTVTQWFAPKGIPKSLRYLVLLVLLAIVCATIVSALKSKRRTTEMRFRLTLLLAEICLIFGVAYILVLFMTISFVDALTPVDMRLLFPLYPVAVLLLISSLALKREIFGHKSLFYRILLGISILIVLSNAARSFVAAQDIRANGVGFQTAVYRHDEIMRFVRDLPLDTVIYSDNPALLYYATQRPAYIIPMKYNQVTTLVNNDFERQMKSLAELGIRKNVVIISFNSEWWVNCPYPLQPELIEKWGFHSILRSAKGGSVLSSSIGSFYR